MLIIAGILSICAPVHAQDVTAKGAGVVGGIVGGAEIVLAVESIIRVKPLWPYIVFPTLGAVGGGIGGYKLEQKTRGGAIALLITSMVGIIPTIIGVSSARAFHPDDVKAKKGDKAPSYDELSIEKNEIGTGETTTEVESRPDGLPSGPMGPPAPPPSVNDAESAPPAPEPESGQVEDADTPSGDNSRLKRKQQERLAHLSSGALIHMNRSLRFGLGVPAIDVFPLELPQPHTHLNGFELHIPVIAIDLP